MSWHNGLLEFYEGENGIIHLAHPFDEGTVCGTYHGGEDLIETIKRTVSCPQCIKFIKMIKRAKYITINTTPR